MSPASCDSIEECINHSIKKSVTNFRKPLGIRLKLTIMLRHLATGETYTSLQYHWLVGKTTIYKFVPVFCRVILAEFQYFQIPNFPPPKNPIHFQQVSKRFPTKSQVAPHEFCKNLPLMAPFLCHAPDDA